MSLIMMGCNQRTEAEIPKEITGKWKTEYVVHYPRANYNIKTIYTDNEVYSCSFQGTNFLLEKNSSEELLSTTAPIEIISSEKLK